MYFCPRRKNFFQMAGAKRKRLSSLPRDSVANLPVPEHLPDIRGAKSALEVLLRIASSEVLDRVCARLQADPEKLTLMILREINSLHVFEEKEEQQIRGVSDKTLRGMKDRGEVPRVMGSAVVALQKPQIQ